LTWEAGKKEEEVDDYARRHEMKAEATRTQSALRRKYGSTPVDNWSPEDRARFVVTAVALED
jgi:hypothetical protein